MDVGTVNILTINAGSSSLKTALFSVNSNPSSYKCIYAVSITNIGQPVASLNITEQANDEHAEQCEANNYSEALDIIFQKITAKIPTSSIATIGHRIVYGGTEYSQPTLITDEVQNRLRSFADFDPEHAPASLEIIDKLNNYLPDIQQIACFDTAFFHDLPEIARLIAVPHKYESLGVRRYGYHGLSYGYLQQTFESIAGEVAMHGRVIFAHLGSGASLVATLDGKPIETTMGFSPTSGVMMSSRLGDVDPSLVWFLNQKTGMNIDEYYRMINFESGLIGVSELSSDMYTLLQNETTNKQARVAIDLFCYQIKKSIGSLASTIGGLDSLVFSGGIGEQSATIRTRICEGLGFLGISLNESTNLQNASLISSNASAVGVHVIPTNEALIIAQQVFKTLYTDDINESIQ